MKPNLFGRKSLNKNIVPASIFIICSTLFFTGSSCDSDDNGGNNPDTTSHNFVWEVDTLGEYGSYLNDVAIIDENNVWVVGYIKIGDSTYNAAHWDGSEWNLYRLPAVTYYGSISQGALTSIYAISLENIWCSSDAGSYVHWNGEEWQSQWVPERNGGINSIWGTSSSDMYFVGGNGSIVHYDGVNFTKMESGTEVDLRNVWGTQDKSTGYINVWACGYTSNYDASILIHFDGVNWQKVWQTNQTYPDLPYHGLIKSIWGLGVEPLFVVGSFGISRQSQQNLEDVQKDLETLPNSSYRVRGSALNNVFVVGNYGMVLHYNGESWYYWEELFNPLDRLKSVDVTDERAFAVGKRYYNPIEWYALIYQGIIQ